MSKIAMPVMDLVLFWNRKLILSMYFRRPN